MEWANQQLQVNTSRQCNRPKLIPANLALSLQQTSGQSLGRTARIGLLDLDIFGPSVPKLMGLEGHEPEMTPGTLDLT